MPNITLQSSDGEIFTTDIQIAKLSGTIKTLLENNENDIVPLPKVNSTTLRKVLDWADYHKDDESKEKSTDDIITWDAAFLDVDRDTTFNLIVAAHYLDIKGLLNSICITGTNLIKGKTTPNVEH